VAEAWPAPASDGPALDAPALRWRDALLDPRLRALVEAALDANRDLRVAALRVDRARAFYRIERADRLPSLSLQAGAAYSSPSAAGDPVGTYYQVGGLVAAFELDFFGRVKSLSDAALATWLATEQAARSARITLVAEVANAYLAERAYAEQLALAEQSLAAREATFALDRQRFDAGVASEATLRQTETLVESARVSVAVLTRSRGQAENALVLLVGGPLGDLPAPLPLVDQGLRTDGAVGLPSTVLLERPDVRAAELQLKAANADIGAARAAFFPRISLTASAGLASADLLGLFAGGVWSFLPSLTQPIFEFGKLRANLRVANIDRDIAVATYEKAIQTAFREVADALVARVPLDAQVEAQARLRDAEARRLELARQRYEAGASSNLELLDAERSLFDAERALVQARQLRLSNAVDLYRALGGGAAE